MTKHRADEPDNKAAERLNEMKRARGIPADEPEEEPELPCKNTEKTPQTPTPNEGTER
ncbi:hypothetical protein [Hymenobacter lucidus]|uniref:Uncharacterized protein n=1 Tax=Hymenobacter lucidus TaxID=2880930 RepID=A0ABS8AXF9_9BACT|nr:hypothetical protein [Hymenobacter lucidus]MCB2410497.1 hypothetical protein [Hymenobacter lucidus]